MIVMYVPCATRLCGHNNFASKHYNCYLLQAGILHDKVQNYTISKRSCMLCYLAFDQHM